MTGQVTEADPRTAWYIERFGQGDTFTTPGRTVTETDLVNYLGMSGFFEEVFMNARMAEASSVFRRRVVPAVLVLAIAEGLLVMTGRLERGVAFLGLSDLAMKAPVAVGDTIRVRLEVRSTRLTSKPGRGILHLFHSVQADDGEVFMEYTSARMVEARPR